MCPCVKNTKSLPPVDVLSSRLKAASMGIPATSTLMSAVPSPLATYTGWNLRDASIGAPQERVSFEGSYIAFPKTAAERLAMQDPRKSIAERYANRDDYMNRYGAAVETLAKQRWLLEEDRAALIERGRQEWDEATK